jgi:type I restriction enzyme S subunit
MVPIGSLIMSTRAPIGHLAVAGKRLCTNQGCKALVFRRSETVRYYYYLLLTGRAEVRSWGQGSTFQELGRSKLESIELVQPPLAEQRAIATFLDRETQKIDNLIAKRERLIGLLEEKRTALISRAVTKGLDPDVPMKDSGVEWLGEIPEHWEEKRLKSLTPDDRPIMYGIVLPGPNVEDGVPIVKGGDVTPGRLRLELLNKTTREIESRYVRSRLLGGDLVYAIRGSIGMVEIVPDEIEGANLTQDAARISPGPAVFGRWLLYALKSKTTFAQLDAGAMGATIRGINIRDLKRAVVQVPPLAEQQDIADYLDRETAKIDALVRKVREHIEKLREYRTALISAAVTGKIDVREEIDTPVDREPDTMARGAGS